MRKLFLLIVSLLFGVSLHAGDFFTGELKSKKIHLIIEGAVGGDFYRSPLSPLYKTDQWAFQGMLTLGYKFNDNIFAGMGGGLRHCQNDQKTGFPIAGSFPAFAMGRYTFDKVRFKPYLDGRIGVVVYPKWNDFVKFYSSIGCGVHIIPRLTVGGQCGWYGTLDNRHTIEVLFCIGFIL